MYGYKVASLQASPYLSRLLAAVLRDCYNCPQCMADWKQITARIRRARTGKDPAGQLSNLYQKTRDAMVAFELARHFETSGHNAEAAKWYSTAAERFRRADWKTKAQEAAVRLSGMPAETSPTTLSDDFSLTPPAVSVPEPGLPFEQTAAAFESIVAPAENLAAPKGVMDDALKNHAPKNRAEDPKRRHRGRRGGRNRRKGSSPRQTAAPVVRELPALVHEQSAPPPVDEAAESRFSRVAESVPSLRLPPESAADSGAATVRGRYGDPGLSSRLSLLEMQFRRLLTCTPLTLAEADRAPAGPGVFLLTDSDLTTYYYVEACQTLRIAVANLLRGGSSRRGGDSLKPQLAEHLGIAESRVSKYLADHCVVRYLQLDEGASHFAHFVIAVLRPALNE